METPPKRVRELSVTPGILPVGKWNAITDVRGVRVGHVTLLEGEDIRLIAISNASPNAD